MNFGPVELSVDVESLRAHRREAMLILRLGAIANGVLAAGRAYVAPRGSLSYIRDNIQYTALVASYAVETARILKEDPDGIVWMLAERVGANEPALSLDELNELKDLLASNSSFLASCSVLRDQHAFHVDKKPVQQWIRKRPATEAIILQTVESTQFASCLFDASAQVVRSAFPVGLEQSAFTARFVRFGTLMPRFAYSIIQGFGSLAEIRVSSAAPAEPPRFKIIVRHLSAAEDGNVVAIEIWPQAVAWNPFFVGIPANSVDVAMARLRFGPRGKPLAARDVGSDPLQPYEGWWLQISSETAVLNETSHYLCLPQLPKLLILGEVNGEQHRSLLQDHWGPKTVRDIFVPPVVVKG